MSIKNHLTHLLLLSYQQYRRYTARFAVKQLTLREPRRLKGLVLR